MNTANATATSFPAVAPGEPVFFFSYARDDCNRFMQKFFTELLDQVRGQTAFDPDLISFHDVTSLGAGELWGEHILRALQNSAVFVAMYTPTYFTYTRGRRCYCGREFEAFRSRSEGSALKPRQTNIVPVLWTIPRYDPDSFPPGSVREISFALESRSNPLPTAYHQFGLEWVWTRDRRKRQDVRDAVVDQILRLAQTPPAPLRDLPNMDVVPCAFHDDDIEVAEFPEARPSAVITGGPGRLVLVYANTGRATADDGEFQVQQAAYRKGHYPQCLQWRPSATGAGGILPTLRASSEANNTTILVIRAEQLRDQEVLVAIKAILADPDWRGGVLLLGRAGQAAQALGSATAMIGTAATPASLADELGRLVTGIGSQLRRSGTPRPGTPDGTSPPRL